MILVTYIWLNGELITRELYDSMPDEMRELIDKMHALRLDTETISYYATSRLGKDLSYQLMKMISDYRRKRKFTCKYNKAEWLGENHFKQYEGWHAAAEV